MGWFEVDKKGLAKLLAKRGKAFAVFDLVQNCWDQNVTRVSIELKPVPGKPLARLVVQDDDPDGFTDLTHAFTLFAESEKKEDPRKRGRFNIGEKLVLALCTEAEVVSTKGAYRFDKNGRKLLKRRRGAGSVFTGLISMTRAELQEVHVAVRTLLCPERITTMFNGKTLKQRKPMREFEAVLQTEIADSKGDLRRTKRKTTVRVHEPLPGEQGTLYEMGIPVVETGDRWHVDVGQKVPLNLDRDNVPPAFLRDLRTQVLNAMVDAIDAEDSSSQWVREATSNPECSDEAITKALDLRFGKNRVVFDPSDMEANKRAMSRGYTVVPGRSLAKAEWNSAKRAGAILPSGQVTPSPKPFSPNGMPLKLLPKSRFTPGIHRLIKHAKAVGADMFGGVPSTTCAGTGTAYVYLGGPGGLSSAPAWVSSGDSVPRAEYGEAVSMGDLDGDGYAEVVVGAPMYYATSMTGGKVFVYSGTPSGPELVPTWTAVGEGSFGIAVSAAGDLNDDGYDDLLISGALAPFTGGVHLYYGASSGLDTAPAWTAVSVSGRTIDSGGDVNGDGYDDLIIGDRMYLDGTDQTGRAYLYLGGSLGPAATYAWTSAGDEQAYSNFGIAVGIAGDVNGDGYADVLVGASRYDTANDQAGKAYLYLGADAPTGLCDPAGVVCDDGDPCSTSSECDSAGMCVGVSFTPVGTACDDGDACTAGDACDGVGACIGSTDVCEDSGTSGTDSGTLVDSGTLADSGPTQPDAGMNVKGGGCSCRMSGVSLQIPLTGCFIVLAGLVFARSLRRRTMAK